MKNKIIPLVVLMIITAFSGCIQSDASNINSLSSNININLKGGDIFFNKAVSDLNKYYYTSSSSNCNNALSKFNSAKASAQQGLTYVQNSKDNVFIQYMELTISEIAARVNATLELQQAITYLQKNDTINGNPHATKANQFMDISIQYKAKKDDLVKQNPSKFKQ